MVGLRLLVVIPVLGAVACMTYRHGPEAVPAGDDDTVPAGDDHSLPSVFTAIPLPIGGSISDLVISTVPPYRRYAYLGAAGLFVSEGDTRIWRLCGSVDGSINSVNPSLSDPDLLYVSEDDTYRVTDDCQTWTSIGGPQDAILLILPDGTLLGGGYDGFERFDGNNWSPIASLFDGTRVSHIAANSTRSHIYAASNTAGVALSTDLGVTWSALTTAFDSPTARDIEVDPENGLRVAIISDRLYLSNNGGADWTDTTNTAYAVGLEPGGSTILVQFWNRLRSSTNNGSTFSNTERRSSIINQARVNEIIFDPADTTQIVISSRRGVFQTTNGSWDSWLLIGAGMSAWQIFGLAVMESGHAFAATGTGVLGRMGSDWELRGGTRPEDSSSTFVTALPSDPGRLWIGFGDMFYSDDEVTTVTLAFNTEEADGWNTRGIVEVAGRFVVGTSTRMQRSTDGVAWTPVSLGSDDRGVQDIMVTPGGTVWVATNNGVFYSDNDGSSYQQWSEGLDDLDVEALQLTAAGNLLAGNDEGIFTSTGADDPWRSTSQPLQVLDFDSVSGVLFAALRDDVVRSDDDGATWQVVPGLEDNHPLCLGADADGSLLVGTNGFGLFRFTP